jgi:hypothetical protein
MVATFVLGSPIGELLFYIREDHLARDGTAVLHVLQET